MKNRTYKFIKRRKEPSMQFQIQYFTIFLSSVGFSITLPSIWPYMRTIDSNARKNELGLMISIFSIGQFLGGPIFGFIAQKMKSFKYPLLISLIFVFVGNFVYSNLLIFSNKTYGYNLMVFARFLLGFGSGNLALTRAFITTFSNPNDKTGRIAIMSACQGLGFIFGPSIQMLFSLLGYPGTLDRKYFKFNMFTGPSYFGLLTTTLNILVIILLFVDKDPNRGEDMNAAANYFISQIRRNTRSFVSFPINYLDHIASEIRNSFPLSNDKSSEIATSIFNSESKTEEIKTNDKLVPNTKSKTDEIKVSKEIMLNTKSKMAEIEIKDNKSYDFGKTGSSNDLKVLKKKISGSNVLGYFEDPNFDQKMIRRNSILSSKSKIERSTLTNDKLLEFRKSIANNRIKYKNGKIDLSSFQVRKSVLHSIHDISRYKRNRDKKSGIEDSLFNRESDEISISDLDMSLENKNESVQYKKMAFILFIFFSTMFFFSALETILTAMMLDQFNLNNSMATFYSSICLASSGLLSLCVFVGIRIFSSRFDDHFLLPVAQVSITLACMALIPYYGPKPVTKNKDSPDTGCPVEIQKWCDTYPALHVSALVIALLLFTVGFCTGSVSTTVLFSKCLGPGSQTIWMGLLTSIGSSARVGGPIYITYFYEFSGLVYSFGLLAVVNLGISILVFIFFKQL